MYFKLVRLMSSSFRHSILLTKHSRTLSGLTSLLMYYLACELVYRLVRSFFYKNRVPFLNYYRILLLFFLSRVYYNVLP